MDLFFLQFPQGLHLSLGAEDPSRVAALPRSDTWTAALLSVWSQVEPGADVERLAAAPPFRVSSALPARRGRGGVEWFLPTPVGLFSRGLRDPRRRKRWQGIRFVAPEALARALRGDAAPAPGTLLQDETIQAAAPVEPGGPTRLFETERTTRLAVDRLSGGAGSGGVFAFARVRFAPEAGMALLVEALDPGRAETLRRVLDALGREGIGGERSSGLGEFTVAGPHPLRLPALGQGGRLLLSLAAPSREAVQEGLLDPPSRYHLVERGGWVSRPGAGSVRRRLLRMLGEGSVLRPTLAEPARAVRVLDPLPALGVPHSVYRGGPALALDVAAEIGE